MSRWDIFRWRTLAGGPPCRQGRQRFPHRAFLSPRPKRVPPFGISDGGGTRDCAGRERVALSVTAAAVPAPPKGEPSLASPFGGGAPVGGGEGSGKPPSWCVTVREKRFAVSLAFFCALRAYKGKVVGLCPTTRKLFEKSLTKNF